MNLLVRTNKRFGVIEAARLCKFAVSAFCASLTFMDSATSLFPKFNLYLPFSNRRIHERRAGHLAYLLTHHSPSPHKARIPQVVYQRTSPRHTDAGDSYRAKASTSTVARQANLQRGFLRSA